MMSTEEDNMSTETRQEVEEQKVARAEQIPSRRKRPTKMKTQRVHRDVGNRLLGANRTVKSAPHVDSCVRLGRRPHDRVAVKIFTISLVTSQDARRTLTFHFEGRPDATEKRQGQSQQGA